MECKLKHTNKLEGEGIVLSLAGKKLLDRGDIVYLEGRCGCFLRVRVNGRPKTWKRDRSRVAVPFKYGLYQHGYIDENTTVRVPLSTEEKINHQHLNWEE